MGIVSLTSRLIGEKRRWWAYRARTRHLPADYRAAVGAVERYLMYLGPTDGDSAATMFEDLVDLFEQAAADGLSIRAVVGANPVEFADAFAQNYIAAGWMVREQQRLTEAIDRASGEEPS